MRNYRKYSLEDVRNAVANNFSLANVIRELGLIPAGGNYQTIKQLIAELDLDVSHHTGCAWNKGRYLNRSELKGKPAIKAALIRDRGHLCEVCLNAEWRGVPITIELEHIDGNRLNDHNNNLKLLCPNCHSQTKTWRRAKSLL